MRALWCVILLAACAMAQDREAALNARVVADFRARNTPVESSLVREYVGRMSERLAREFPGITLTVETVNEAVGGHMREPVALPGGEIYVPAGLIVAARDGAEVAAMLAHAMAHAAAGD